ncbi:primase C-terminal domain-containing protein [Arthrobacter antibioticus]|uniref:primase C-terminal domain-containing protein n=1 Tax=Arthrobacter sp. H35-MC1 TaxID=3046203 RepID=UPI0024BBAFB0|nr:primase C-terminal domain-containing protein [Arthrobacter sp. H35-MC1]MDJ0318670.1 primase C-terminal domain-containing protein [Arthrobacter sp. H35-MC1]
MPPVSWQRTKRRDPVGLGRNCTIFETARTWAYRELRHHFGDPSGLHRVINDEVHSLNATFSEPLPLSESKAIATSIHKWIITKSRMWQDGPAVYEATFSTIQSARGRKGGIQSGLTRRGGQTLEELVSRAMKADKK